MPDKSIKILYGDEGFNLKLQEHWNPNIIRKPKMPIIKDINSEIDKIFINSVGCESLKNVSKKSKTACILVCDITRPVPNNLYIEKLIKKLIEYKLTAENILILIATGLHRPASKKEIKNIIGSDWVLKNINIKNHFARDDQMHSTVGITTKGNEIKLDKRFLNADLKIVTGLVEPHFMAGYSGGRKVIAPGIAHASTITRFHSAKYMEDKNAKSCNLINNPLHEDQLEIVNMIGNVYAINCVIDENRKLSFINFGDVIKSHEEAVNFIKIYAIVKCDKKYDTIITSAAGAPLDGNFYQTVKGMVTPLDILKKGGDLIILSKCNEGLGSEEFKQSQLNLLNIGSDKFLKNILNKKHAEIDEWQTEMEIKSLTKGNIYLFSDGLTKAEEQLTGVNIIYNVENKINESINNHNNSNIAIIPEGPYVIPTN
tara:strand:+ start:15615 stop:16898 length:1284 start_codon:yes stop_codon:yes gene_type:complete